LPTFLGLRILKPADLSACTRHVLHHVVLHPITQPLVLHHVVHPIVFRPVANLFVLHNVVHPIALRPVAHHLVLHHLARPRMLQQGGRQASLYFQHVTILVWDIPLHMEVAREVHDGSAERTAGMEAGLGSISL
jgi:hypothetical protein